MTGSKPAAVHRAIVSIPIPGARNRRVPSSTSILPRVFCTGANTASLTAKIETRSRDATARRGPFTAKVRVATHANTRIGVSRVRVFSDDFPFPDATNRAAREREKNPSHPLPFSRPSLPNHRARVPAERRRENGPAFNVNRHARLIRGRKERERPRAEV